MPREVEDHYPDVYPAARNPPCPQQLHYYNERRHPQGAYFAGRFDRGDMGAPYYPYESWSAFGRSYPRPEFEYGPGSPFVRDAYGRARVDAYQPHRNDYRRRSAEERDFRSPDGTRDGSVEHEHSERKRRHHKSSKHRHRRSRHHRRHKRSKQSEMHSDDEHSNDLPSLTLGAEISRGRRHGASSVAKMSAPGSDISEDSSHSQSVVEPSDSIGASVALSVIASADPVVYSGNNVENDEGEVAENDDSEVADPTTNVVEKQQSIDESDDTSSSDAESLSKKSQSSTSSSESGSPNGKKHRTKLQPVTKVRSSYAIALAAKLRQNRLALEERSCRRPDTSSSGLQPSDGSPSVIDKSSVNTETSRLCSDSNLVVDNGLNVERVVTTSRQVEIPSSNSVVSCSAPLRVNSSTQLSVSRSAMHRESHSTASLNWYVLKMCILAIFVSNNSSVEFNLAYCVH